MRRIPASARSLRSLLLALIAGACGGGGDGGGTQPPTVASVAITAPAAPPAFQTLTRTVQFTAVARDAANATLAGAVIAWNSSNASVATVNGSGLVTAAGNGTTQITASSSGVTSPAVAVTVAQVVATVNVTPAAVAFGALGSSRTLTAAPVDSSGATVSAAPVATWTRAGTGATATVSAGGLATALAIGASDTAVATIGTKTGRIPISVTQVVASILVNSTGPDTLKTTTRTKQYTAIIRDSQVNTFAGPTIGWSSSVPGVASVGAVSGLATAVTDGGTNIIATASGVPGQRALVVRRYAQTFTLTPPTATITTPLGTQIFLGTAQDSVATDLAIAWVSRSVGIASLSSASGPQVTATGRGNGTSYIVMSAGTRGDSSFLTVSGQPTAPLTASVAVDNFFFQSTTNSTRPAADTVAVGGTVTWTWVTSNHSVQSQGSPSFISSATKSSGTYQFMFNTAGTYAYDCAVHGPSMSGTVVVR